MLAQVNKGLSHSGQSVKYHSILPSATVIKTDQRLLFLIITNTLQWISQKLRLREY